MQLDAIRERVQHLRQENAKLRVASEEHLSKRAHSPGEVLAQARRELRLQQIVEELSSLRESKKNN